MYSKRYNSKLYLILIYYFFTTFESENKRSYNDIGAYSPKIEMPRILVNSTSNSI